MTSYGILLVSLKLWNCKYQFEGTFQRLHARNVDLCRRHRHRQVFLSDISRTRSEWSLVLDKSSGMVSLRGHREYARFKPEIDRPEKWDLDACSNSLKVYLQSRPKEGATCSVGEWSKIPCVRTHKIQNPSRHPTFLLTPAPSQCPILRLFALNDILFRFGTVWR